MGGDTALKWPWLVVGLVVLVAVLLAVWVRVWFRRTPRGASYVAHAARLRSLPRYRTLVRRRTTLGALTTVAALVAASGAIILAGRVQETQTMEQDDRSRDIILCLDASGSMAEEDAEVVAEFRTIVEGLEGERIGLTIWNGVAITVFPLTDDYEFALDQLDTAQEAFDTEDYDYTAGTVLLGDEASSQMGDGLASCVQRFDRQDEERARSVILASDNDPQGRGVYTFAESTAYAIEHDVIVHGIAAQDTADRAYAVEEFEQGVTATGGTFALLGTDGTAATLVDEIDDLEAERIEKPPVIQTLDRPLLGTVVTAVGVGLLVVVWLVQAGFAVARRRAS